MSKEYILISDQLPEKNKDIIGIDDKGNKTYAFRCACPNLECIEWRCSATGLGLMIDIVKWQYVKKD